MAHCPNCQQPVDADARFCGGCGAPLPEVSRPDLSQAATSSGPMTAVTDVDQLIGRTLNGRYRLERKVGEGGFGAVFEGVHLQMKRPVAIKVLHPRMTRDPKLVARFQREAQAACSLRDAHTVTTHDFDKSQEGVLYIVMELIRGRSLLGEIKEHGALPIPRVLNLVDQICSSLAEAHERGIVHRDIKPENILIEDRGSQRDYIKVVDFGIAKMMEDPQGDTIVKLTAAGQVFGTLEYMSPEQLEGSGTIDHRTDIYSLGVMLFQMLTGKLPFTGSPSQVILFHLNEEPAAPSSIKTDLPAALDRIVLRCLAKDPAARFGDIGELRAELAAFARLGRSETVVSAAGPASIPPTAIQPDNRAATRTGPGARGPAPVHPARPAAATAPVTRPTRRGLPVGAWIGIIAGGVFTLLAALAVIGAIAGDGEKKKSARLSITQPTNKTVEAPEGARNLNSGSLARLAGPDDDLVVLVRPKRLLEIPGMYRFINNHLTREIRQLFTALKTGPDRLDEVLTVVPRLPEAAWDGKKTDPEFLIAARELDADAAVRWFKKEHRATATEEEVQGLSLHSAAGTSIVALDKRTLVGGHTRVVKSGLRAARTPPGAFAPHPEGIGLLVIRLPATVQPKLRQTFGLDPPAAIGEVRASLTHEQGIVRLLIAAGTDSGATARTVARWLRQGLRYQRRRASRSQLKLLRQVRIRRDGASVSLRLTGQDTRLLEALQITFQPRSPYPPPAGRRE